MKSVFASPPPGYYIIEPKAWDDDCESHMWMYVVFVEDGEFTSRDFNKRRDCIQAAWEDFALRFLDSRAVWAYPELYVSEERRFVPCPALQVGGSRLTLKHPSWDIYPGTYLLTTEDGPPHGFDDLTEAMLAFIGAIFQHELSLEPEAPDASSTRK